MSEAPKRLTLDVRRGGGKVVVRVEGSAGISEAEEMRSELERLADEQIDVIVLDLEAMDFICSAGLAAIIAAHLRCRHHQGRIQLVNPQPAVRELLETTRLTKLFPILPEAPPIGAA